MRILIVKPGSLADVVQAMPVVHDIGAAHPGALIDWVVEPALAPLLRRVDGVADVVGCPLRRWRRQWWTAKTRAEWRVLRARLQRESYDAVIDMQGSTPSALIARLARGRRFGIAERSDGLLRQAPARWLVDRSITLPPQSHAVDGARQLVAKVLGYAVDGMPDFGLHAAVPAPAQPTVVFVHGSSQPHKLWPDARWIALGRRFTDAGWQIALPHGDETEQVRAERLAAAIDSEATAFGDTRPIAGAVVQVWPRLPIDHIADRLGAAQGVIGIDSGLSQLAVALGLPHLQIYLHPTAWRTGPQRQHGRAQQRSIGGDSIPSVDEVWAAWQRIEARTPAASAA